MSLSCDCNYADYDQYYVVEDVERSACATGKCYGCRGPISIGDEVRRMHTFQYDEHGGEVNWKVIGRLCPVCSGLYDSLMDLGFCLEADWGFISEAMDDYRVNYGSNKKIMGAIKHGIK